jgi:Peptidase A4 family
LGHALSNNRREMILHTKHILKLTAAVVAGSAAVVTMTASSAAAATVAPEASTSSNWAGYVAQGNNFSSVSGSWVEPAVKCTSGSGYSAFWVGLGGSSGQSGALEQTGTQSDCNSDGQADYYAWYELVPAAPVNVNLAVKPGDHITGKVTVSGTNVTISLSNQTTGASVTKNLQTNQIDTSSAEWIAEAPSSCDQTGNCQPLPLADFSTANFSNASATAGGHTGSISDSNWTAQPVALGGGSGGGSGGSYYGYGPTATAYDQSGSAGAEPSQLSGDGSSFSVSWQSSNGSSSPASDSSGGYGAGSSGGYGDGSGGYGSSGGYGYGDGSGGYGSSGGYGGYGGYGDSGYGYAYSY